MESPSSSEMSEGTPPLSGLALPSNGITFTDAHVQTLSALADTFITPLSAEAADRLVKRFAVNDDHASDIRRFAALSGAETDTVAKLMAAMNDPLKIPRVQAGQLSLGIHLLSTCWGSLLLAGAPTAFYALSRPQRAQAIAFMLTSSFELRRLLAYSLRCLLCIITFSSVTPAPVAHPLGMPPALLPPPCAVNGASAAFSPVDSLLRTNPTHRALQYPGPDASPAAEQSFVHTPLVFPPAAPAPASTPVPSDSALDVQQALAAAASGWARALLNSSVSGGIPRSLAPTVTLSHAALRFLQSFPASPFGPPGLTSAGDLCPPTVSLPSDSGLPVLELQADAVIVGSGAGGGVAAAALAKAGRRVLVLEKGQYYPASVLTGVEEEAMQAQYEGKSLLTSADGGMAILAGSTLGGGTAVNWACSLDLPYYVRQEWARNHALSFVVSPAFSRALDAVSRRLNVRSAADAPHNGPNTLLLRGAKALGHPAGPTGQNAGPAHQCGWCGLGCRGMGGGKQSSTVTFLKDAVESGARIVTGCYVEKVIVENPSALDTTGARPGVSGDCESVSVPVYGPETPDSVPPAAPSATAAATAARGPSSCTSARAAGVSAIATSPHGRCRLVISAPLVVVAAGALHSPLLLRRSGVRNKHVGRNLRLHPVAGACGLFDRGVEWDQKALVREMEKMQKERDLERASTKAEGAPAAKERSQSAAEYDSEESVSAIAAAAAAAAGSESDHGVVTEDDVFADGRARARVVTREVDCFQGAIMTSVDNIGESGENDGYGTRLEVPSIHPGLAAFACNWVSGPVFKESMLSFRRLSPIIVLSRDKGSGSVTQGPHGAPVVNYRVSPRDERSLLKGLIHAYHVLAAAGATRLVPPQFALKPVEIDPEQGTRDPRFRRFIRSLAAAGIRQTEAGLFSAHQMGTCRMHGIKREGVAKPTGESWDVSNLFICDASLFPTSSGVNPMLTVLTLAHCVAAHAARRLEQILAPQSSMGGGAAVGAGRISASL